MKRIAACVVAVLAVTASAVWSQNPASAHVMLTVPGLKWGEGPPALPKGAQLVVLSGDPGKNGPFAIRLKGDYSAAYRGLGRALEQVGRPDEAKAAYVTGCEVAARNARTVSGSSSKSTR